MVSTVSHWKVACRGGLFHAMLGDQLQSSSCYISHIHLAMELVERRDCARDLWCWSQMKPCWTNMDVIEVPKNHCRRLFQTCLMILMVIQYASLLGESREEFGRGTGWCCNASCLTLLNKKTLNNETTAVLWSSWALELVLILLPLVIAGNIVKGQIFYLFIYIYIYTFHLNFVFCNLLYIYCMYIYI